jgi:hypothetical protein
VLREVLLQQLADLVVELDLSEELVLLVLKVLEDLEDLVVLEVLVDHAEQV